MDVDHISLLVLKYESQGVFVFGGLLMQKCIICISNLLYGHYLVCGFYKDVGDPGGGRFLCVETLCTSA